jgi:UDP-N-acetylglucosamine 2-epimerase (non-hydrolysing)
METRKKSVMFVFGTRPEAIKLAPVIKKFEEEGSLDVHVCVTAQHREMMDQFLAFFDITPDSDLDLMTPNQSLAALTAKVISGAAEVYQRFAPDMVFVQGDTSSAFAAAMAASLNKIPVAHVEAGLRSHQRHSPFPEETNRVLIGHIADLHFAHTDAAATNLKNEGVTKEVHVVGNTVVDALKLGLRTIDMTGDEASPAALAGIDLGKNIALITLHRRESIGAPMLQTCLAIRQIAEAHPDVELVYPVHLNPRVREVVYESLSGLANVHLLDPLAYPDFLLILSKASLVITDSGGVVEEASTLGIPILVAREFTERAEAVTAGLAKMVGSDTDSIVRGAREILQGAAQQRTESMNNVFGDGNASERIVAITKCFLKVPPATNRDRGILFMEPIAQGEPDFACVK